MKQSKLAKATLNLVGGFVLEHAEYEPNTITMNVKDVIALIGGKDLMDFIKGGLETVGFRDIYFTFGDGHWMTVHNNKR